MTKKDIFSKIIRNSNDELEIILEKKAFDSNVKNLLLSMLYKVESGYDDYKKVKVNVCSKNQFIKEVLDTINNKCEKISFISPSSKEGKELIDKNINCIVDKKNKTIRCFQNEKSILDGILQIRQEDIKFNDKDEITSKPFKEMLLIGNNMNCLELITDFNGWSWDITLLGKKNTVYNYIYQMLIILVGNSKIDRLVNNRKEQINEKMPNNLILSSKYNEDFGITKKEIIGEEEDFITKMKKILKDKYGEENEKEFFKRMMQVVIFECQKKDLEYSTIIRNKINELKKEFNKMSSNKIFIENLTKKKKELVKKIEHIDFIVSDEKKLTEEYKKRNEKLKNENKIFSPSHLRLMLKKQRQILMDEIQTINKNMEPNEFVKIKETLKEKIEFYDEINLDDKTKENTIRLLEILRLSFENCLQVKIEKAESNEEISNLLYELRYYFLTQNRTKTKNNQIEKLKNILIRKACEKNILTVFSEEVQTNRVIIQPVFTSRIIDLDKINYVIKYSKGIISIEIFDGSVHEETKQIKITKQAVINVKLNKKIKLWQ